MTTETAGEKLIGAPKAEEVSAKLDSFIEYLREHKLTYVIGIQVGEEALISAAGPAPSQVTMVRSLNHAVESNIFGKK